MVAVFHDASSVHDDDRVGVSDRGQPVGDDEAGGADDRDALAGGHVEGEVLNEGLIRRVVGSPRGISPRGSHGTERDSLPSLRSSHPLHWYARIQAQWAKSSGSLSVTPRHHALNRFQVRSRTYFFRAHRIT